MKKLSKIKLNQFSKDELDRRKMNALKGGCACTYGGGCPSRCGSWVGNPYAWEIAMSADYHSGSTDY